MPDKPRSLPFDIARCEGSGWPECGVCRRREPGRPMRQYTMLPPIQRTPTQPCKYQITHKDKA